MPARTLTPLLTFAGLTLCTALLTGCTSGKGDSAEPEYDPSGVCPSDAGPLDPIVEVTPAPYHLSGSARRGEDGGLEIVINPIVNTDDGSARGDLTLEEVEVIYDGETVVVDSLQKVEAGDVSFQSDVMFVLDSTSSMWWAIDGVKSGINQFVDVIDTLGVDVQVGGVEFGDEVRTSLSPTSTADFRTWMDELSATGGGDLPENPLDAIASAWESFDWRPGAQRYIIVITDVGMHESGNEAGCSLRTLADIDELTGDRALYGVLMATLGGDDNGVPVQWLTEAMGGLYAEISVTDAMLSFDISLDTAFDELLGDSYVATVTPEALEGLEDDEVTVGWNPGERLYQMQLPVE